MKRIGIFYGSTTGATAAVAHEIAKRLGVGDEDIHNVADTAPTTLAGYDVLLLGSSTWGAGEMQDDWQNFIAGAEMLDLEGRTAALFGCGDETMSETFANALGEIRERMERTRLRWIGEFDVDGYEFGHSKSVADGVAVGLIVDEENHAATARERINRWCDSLGL